MLERGRVIAHHPCEKLTRKGNPCPIEADRCRDGVWLCHVHDPEGQARKNIEGRRQDRRDRKVFSGAG